MSRLSSVPSEREEGLDVVRPVLEPMSAAEIAALLQRFPAVGKFESILSVSGRPYSAGTLVRTETRDVFVKKRTAQWRSKEDIEREHALIAHLRSRGFSTPAVLANEAGETVTAEGPWLYEVFERAEGEDVYRESHSWMPFAKAAHAYSAGRRLAEFHRAVQGFELPPAAPHRPMVARFDLMRQPDLPAAIEAEAGKRPSLATYLEGRPWRQRIERAYGPFHERIQPLLVDIPSSATHGDWHGNNLFFRGDEVVSVIDFHLCDMTFRMYDLVVALDRNAVEWLAILDGQADAVRYDLIDAMLAGYQSVLPLSPVEKRLLPDLLAVHQLDLALSNIHYYLEVEQNIGRAHWAYEVYLLEHADYFHTDAGRRLLDAVASCLSGG